MQTVGLKQVAKKMKPEVTNSLFLVLKNRCIKWCRMALWLIYKIDYFLSLPKTGIHLLVPEKENMGTKTFLGVHFAHPWTVRRVGKLATLFNSQLMELSGTHLQSTS